MLEEVSNSQKLLKKLKEEGKVLILNRPEDLETTRNFNQDMEEVSAEYTLKDMESEISAKSVILTT